MLHRSNFINSSIFHKFINFVAVKSVKNSMGKDIRSFFGVSNGASQGSKRQEAPEESSEESGKRKRKGRLQDVEPVDELDSGKKESSKNKKVSMSRAKKSTGGVSKKNTKKSAYFLDESNSDDGDVPYQPKYTALAKRKQRSVESDEDEDDSLVKNQAARKFTKKQAISVEEDEDFIDTTVSCSYDLLLAC